MASSSFACADLTAAAASSAFDAASSASFWPIALLLGERLQARGFALGLRLLRLRAGDVGLARGGLRRERLGIDDEQRLPGLDRRAFLEQPLLEDAVDARAHLDFLGAQRLADVFERDGQRLRRDRLDASPRRAGSRGSRRLLLLAAGGESRASEGDGQEDARNMGASVTVHRATPARRERLRTARDLLRCNLRRNGKDYIHS